MQKMAGLAVVDTAFSAALICYKMADKLISQLKLVKHNKEQSQLLCRRVNTLVGIVRELDEKRFSNQPSQYVKSLKRFQIVLDAVSKFVIKNQKKIRLRRFLSAKSIQNKFHELNKELAAVLAELNVGIQSERIFRHEDDEKALHADFQELRLVIEDVKRAETELVDEAIGGLLSRADKDELHLKKIEAIDAALADALGTKPHDKEQDVISPELVIPFSDLAFKNRIGEGVFGKIFLGEWCKAPVVIKEVGDIGGFSAMNEFKREVQILSDLRSPYVVQFFGACIEKNSACIIMEYMPEGSLTEYLARNAELDLASRYKIMLSIVKGLCYLHGRGVLHRDIKSENILVTADGMAKWADFGLAKSRATHVRTSESVSHATAYFSPEIINHQTYTVYSEIFSLGMLLWEVIEGVRPFSRSGMNDAEILDAISKGQRETLSSNFPAPYARIIRRCWSASPNQRPNIDEILNVLSEARPPLASVRGWVQSADALFAQAERYEFVNDIQRAVDYYEQAITAGHVKANTNLGLLMSGAKDGIANDPARANQLWETAANLGHERAMHNLVVQYTRGDGIPIDKKRAAYWQAKLKQPLPITQKLEPGQQFQPGMFHRRSSKASNSRCLFQQQPGLNGV